MRARVRLKQLAGVMDASTLLSQGYDRIDLNASDDVLRLFDMSQEVSGDWSYCASAIFVLNFTHISFNQYNSLLFGHSRGTDNVPCEPLDGNDSGWQRHPTDSGLQLCIGSHPILYLLHVSHTASNILQSGLVDEDDNLMQLPRGHEHGHWKRTPLGTDTALDITFNFYNSKNSAPAKPTGNNFEHLDANLARLEATARDGRKDSRAVLALRQAIATQYIINITNNQGTSITFSRVEVPEERGVNKSKPYCDVVTQGHTDGSYSASNPFVDGRIQYQGFTPTKEKLCTWSGDDMPGTGFVFSNELFHTVSKPTSGIQKAMTSAVKKRLDKIIPLQPTDSHGRCTDRGAVYPYFVNNCLHGTGHVPRDTLMIDTFLRGIPADIWPHVFTGNPIQKRQQPIGPSLMGPPPGSQLMKLTPLARALLIPGTWQREPLASSWLLEPLLNAPGDESHLEEAKQKALSLHSQHMVMPLQKEYLSRIELVSDPTRLQDHIAEQQFLATTTDNLVRGSERILFKPEIAARAKNYHKKMSRKPYTFKSEAN